MKVAYCGICGSDVHEFQDGPIFTPQPGSKHPNTGAELPVTMGHEMSGTILEVGTNVQTLRKGQNVCVNPCITDASYGQPPCKYCKIGKSNICTSLASYGMSASGGGFADEIVVKAQNCLVLPDGVSLELGALAEPLSVGWHSVRLSGIIPGQTALIQGAGPIGLAILVLLKTHGVDKVVMTEVTEQRTHQAYKFGATLVVNPLSRCQVSLKAGKSEDMVTRAVHDLLGEGVDVTYDAVGLQSTLDTALRATKPGGTIFNVAIHEKPLLLNLNDIARAETKLMGGICQTNEDVQHVLEVMASGKVALEEFITSVVPLDDIVQRGFHELIHHKENHIKILVKPGA